MAERTSSKVWAGVAAGLLTTAVLALVGIGAYRAGQRSDATIEVVGRAVGQSDATRTVVVDGWHGGWHGPWPGFFLFPLIIVGLVILFATRRGRGWGGGPRDGGDRERHLDDWHRRAHGADVAPASPAVPPIPPNSPTD